MSKRCPLRFYDLPSLTCKRLKIKPRKRDLLNAKSLARRVLQPFIGSALQWCEDSAIEWVLIDYDVWRNILIVDFYFIEDHDATLFKLFFSDLIPVMV